MSDDRTLTRKQIVQTIEKWENTDRQGHFAVVLGETVGYIGCYGFRPLHSAVMGIAVARKYWGKGLAFDAQEVLLKFLFDELGLRVVEYYAHHRELVDHPSV